MKSSRLTVDSTEAGLPVVGSQRQAWSLIPGAPGLRYHWQSSFECITADMIELNPVRQRITDLTDRVLSLRGYL
ncbi:hypothetical protein BN1263200170 [Stenotrophomonas maltophilia]|nr:hypothetical protein BN1263200170 [Stenotrophomonas maltophilia]